VTRPPSNFDELDAWDWEELGRLPEQPAFRLIGGRVAITHRCNPDKFGDHPVLALLPYTSPDGWKVTKTEPLTVQPSIRCSICGFHGHITDGVWRPAK
jgi:hypothetical protein